tara:strand:+ start:27107 stop:27352 length:246 start_codon:yes stop_codon:yes gene_type:complete
MAKTNLNKHQRDAFNKAHSILSEHFEHYGLVVLDEEDILEYDYSKYYIGKMLFREVSSEMNKDEIEFVMEDEIIDEEEDGT